MKETIIIYLLIMTFSILNAIEFGKDIPFDTDNNNTFELNFTENGSLFVQIDLPIGNLLELSIQYNESKVNESDNLESFLIYPPGKSIVIPFQKEKTFIIKLISRALPNETFNETRNDTGIIWMNPSISEIKVDLNKTYEWKYDYLIIDRHNITSCLTYSIDNAETDVIFEFNYNPNLRFINGNYITANPLKILDKNYSESGITTYEIKKGESYKIITSISNWITHANPDPEYIHFLPSFSFHFIVPEQEKKVKKFLDFSNLSRTEIVFLISIGILIIGVIVLICCIICIKNKKSDNEINKKSKYIELELENLAK